MACASHAALPSFVPKPFTPFQWFGQDTHDQIVEKQTKLRDILHKVKGVNFNYHESELSMLEACFARGDRRMGDVLYAAWKNGCRMDGWSEFLNYEGWLKAFDDCGLDPAFYANRSRGERRAAALGFYRRGRYARLPVARVAARPARRSHPRLPQGLPGLRAEAF